MKMTPIDQARQLVDEASRSPNQWEQNGKAARALLEAALEENTSDTILLTCLGTVLSDLGQHDRAVSLFEQAIELGSTDRNAYRNLAIALMNVGPEARARAPAFFKQAEALKPCPQTWEAYFDRMRIESKPADQFSQLRRRQYTGSPQRRRQTWKRKLRWDSISRGKETRELRFGQRYR